MKWKIIQIFQSTKQKWMMTGMMTRGYPYFRKPPHGDLSCELLIQYHNPPNINHALVGNEITGQFLNYYIFDYIYIYIYIYDLMYHFMYDYISDYIYDYI